MKKVIAIFILIFVIAFGKDEITYPKSASKFDTRYLEQQELLKIALEKTKKEYGAYTLKESKKFMTELRYVEAAKLGMEVNVIWYGTSDKIEKELIPIRIPLGKGILGYRIFLINEKNKNVFKNVKTIEDLRKYTVGQGRDWGDVKVFKDNGIKVGGGMEFEGLFDMLASNRFDFFSRGISEAYNEFEVRKGKYPNMMVEETLALYYPWPYYFFVSPKFPKLAERIEKGMQIMVKDGTFDKIFMKYNEENIKKANLKGRKIIKLQNLSLPTSTPLDNKEFWFTPEF